MTAREFVQQPDFHEKFMKFLDDQGFDEQMAALEKEAKNHDDDDFYPVYMWATDAKLLAEIDHLVQYFEWLERSQAVPPCYKVHFINMLHLLRKRHDKE